jgi:hypothetical protein
MAESKHTNLGADGLMVAGMAYRVKYRKVNTAGEAIKIYVHIGTSGVHEKNRGGVYPNGIRCKSLCVEVVQAGFVKEEVNHACIAVEEAPIAAVAGKFSVCPLVSASTYNAENSNKDEFLSTCFQVPYEDVRHKMLSHNHMMLILRAFLTKAQWDLPTDVEKNIAFCDSDGRLSLTAVAASTNGKEMAEVMAEGFHAEVLSWRMDAEEPDAASIISLALNQPQQMSMRTTELTAMKVLKGEIIVQMGKDVSQLVAFQTVRDRVRAQLHTAADDPDMPEVFEFLISAGVSYNSYIDHLLEWTGLYVDSKKRQLRFAAFAVINKMCEQAVWSKIAVVKRAYRKKPVNSFCPSPEAAWGEFAWAHLQKLEDLLRFFHVACKAIVDTKTPQSRIQLLANIDIAAAETFWAAKDPKLKYGEQKIQALLLEATKKYLAPLGLEEDEEKMKSLTGRANWILFQKDAEPAAAEDLENASAVTVINFDELTGAQLNRQLDFPDPALQAHKMKPQKLPWREWRSDMGSFMGDTEADKSAAVAVLHSLHWNYDVGMEPIEVWQHNGRNYVTATLEAKPRDIMLPPCVPKQSKVLERSEHPYAVQINVRVVQRPEAEDPDLTDQRTVRTSTFFVNPEFKTPTQKEVTAAVAEANGSDSAAVADEKELGDAAVAVEWIWGVFGETTMHPFWAVRRMTDKQRAKAAADEAELGKVPLRFNCHLEMQTVSCVCVGVVKSRSLNTTRVYQVPFLTNSLRVEEGEELILQVHEKKHDKAAPKRTWKHAFHEAAERAKKEAQERVKKEAQDRAKQEA